MGVRCGGYGGGGDGVMGEGYESACKCVGWG